jgi:methionyl-tRNA formyltransferase
VGTIVFAGTAAFAVPALQGLCAAGYEVPGVITQPDRPSGRGQVLQAPPVKLAAIELGLSVHQPTSLDRPKTGALFEALRPDLIVVVAYGRIIPPWLIALPRYGIVNLHGSLLPRYRGAAPIQWAVANGETETGVCTMKIDEGLDTGAVYLCEKTSIGPDEPVPELSQRLAAMGSALMQRTVRGVFEGTLAPTPQDHSRATYAPILRKSDGHIDWRLPARTIHNRVRAFQPWPGAVTLFRGAPCKILKTQVGGAVPAGVQTEEGTLVAGLSARQSLAAVCGDGVLLELLALQIPGRKPWLAADFLNSMKVAPGEKFERVKDN